MEIFWSSALRVKPQSNKRKTELDINLMQIAMDRINLFLLLQFVRFIFLIELNTEGVIVKKTIPFRLLFLACEIYQLLD